MRKTALSIAVAGALAVPFAARAGAYAEIHLELPEILPPPVVIQTGVQVIPEIQHEVFLVGGVYYTRHGERWYRASNPSGGTWMGVQPQAVPASLVKIPPGKYKGWKPSKEEKATRKQAKRAAKQGNGHGKH